MVATSCDLNAPRCTTKVQQVRLHGSRGGVFIGHRPPRDPGESSHMGINGCSSTTELDAQYAQPHEKPKWLHLQEKDMPVACCCTCHVELRKLELQWQKWSFWLFQTAVRWKRCVPKGTLGQHDERDIAKRLMNGKADCFTLLRWIAKLKCVNSEVKSVLSHPKNGCLNWLHGTMSESLWKSHQTRVDLWRDPSGTESPNAQLD